MEVAGCVRHQGRYEDERVVEHGWGTEGAGGGKQGTLPRLGAGDWVVPVGRVAGEERVMKRWQRRVTNKEMQRLTYPQCGAVVVTYR